MDGQTLKINGIEYHFSPRQLKYRYLFQNSKYLCAKYLCGFHEGAVEDGKITFPMNWHLHGSILYLLQHKNLLRFALEMPRGSFKTSMMIGDIIHEIINNPNIRIGWTSGNMPLCRADLQHLKDIILSPVFKALFPEIIPLYSPNSPQSDWSRTQFTVNRTTTSVKEPTVFLFTQRSKIEGWHFDKLYYDDCQNRDNSQTETGREGVKDFYRDGANLINDDNTPIYYIYTPWHPDDANEEVKKKPNTTVCSVPLYGKDGEVHFPEKFTPERIQHIRSDFYSEGGGGDKMFTTQYLLQAVSDLNAPLSHCPSYMRYTEEEKINEEGEVVIVRKREDGKIFEAPILGTIIILDTSGQGQDTCGVMVLKRDNDDYWWVRYAKEGRGWLPSKRFAELIALDKQFCARRIVVEVFGQISISDLLGEERIENSDVGYKFKEIKHHSKAKDERIMYHIEPKLQAGKIAWHIGVPEPAIKQVKYYREMTQDTIPDVLAYGCQAFEEEKIRPYKQYTKARANWKPHRPGLFKGVKR